MKTKLILIITTIILTACSTPQHCYGQNLTIYSVPNPAQLEVEKYERSLIQLYADDVPEVAEVTLNKDQFRLQKGKNLMILGYTVVGSTALWTMTMPTKTVQNHIDMLQVTATGYIAGGLITVAGHLLFESAKRKIRKKRNKKIDYIYNNLK